MARLAVVNQQTNFKERKNVSVVEHVIELCSCFCMNVSRHVHKSTFVSLAFDFMATSYAPRNYRFSCRQRSISKLSRHASMRSIEVGSLHEKRYQSLDSDTALLLLFHQPQFYHVNTSWTHLIIFIPFVSICSENSPFLLNFLRRLDGFLRYVLASLCHDVGWRSSQVWAERQHHRWKSWIRFSSNAPRVKRGKYTHLVSEEQQK